CARSGYIAYDLGFAYW
nr:immunoglobulin heavy chain junction region [Mus musculus]MBK4195998.1 immunoglobulin heavy chain junction region [Mus musculus]